MSNPVPFTLLVLAQLASPLTAQAVEYSAEALTITSSGDAEEADGGTRAWARNDQFAAMLRVLPIEGRWLVYMGRCPLDRLNDVGGAMHLAMSSLELGPDELPTWATPL